LKRILGHLMTSKCNIEWHMTRTSPKVREWRKMKKDIQKKRMFNKDKAQPFSTAVDKNPEGVDDDGF